MGRSAFPSPTGTGGRAPHFRTAAHLFAEMVKNPKLDEFLTLPAYELLA